MEMKTELTLWDKLKSWKRWMAGVAAALPIGVQAYTDALGWPVAVSLSVAALISGVLGLSKEDSARLEAAGKMIAASIAASMDKKAAESPKDPEKPAGR